LSLRREESIDGPGRVRESRAFARFDEVLGNHRLTEELNVSDAHLADSGDQPSLRANVDRRRLMLGVHDTATWGERSIPFLLRAYVQYRHEPSVTRPAHLELGLPSTYVNLFSGLKTGALFGDVTQSLVGPGYSPLELKEDYVSLEVNVTRQYSRHALKTG
jgi:hypothetical protein